MDPTRYFDYAATTPLSPSVLEAMMPWLTHQFGNAHSIHGWGREARFAVEQARERVAQATGAESPEEVVFTSGATESLNWVLRHGGRFSIGPGEHSAVRQTAETLGMAHLSYADLLLALPGERLAVMRMSNETGELFDLSSHAGRSSVVASDYTQAIGKVPVDFVAADSGVHWAAWSAHKFYGPQGVGVLYARGQAFPEPLLTGGSHEWGFRAGTLNVAGIVGLGAAIQEAEARREARYAHVTMCHRALLEALDMPEAHLTNHLLSPEHTFAPHVLPLLFEGIEGETLVVACDTAGFGISAGAACSSGSTEPSAALLSLGIAESVARGYVRVSFGDFNTLESSQELGKFLRNEAKRLKNTNS